MRTRKKDVTNLLKVGAFLAGLLVVLMIFVVTIGKENSIFSPKVDLKARVPDVGNLKAGASVELKGIRIGTVSDVSIISEEEVEITLTILEEQLRWLKKDSRVSVSTAGLVGDKYLEVYSGSKEAPRFDPEKDFLLSESSTTMKAIMNKGESIAAVTERILGRIDLILHNLDDGKKLVATMNSIQLASANLEKVTAELRDAQLSGMVKNVNASTQNLNLASANLGRILTRVEKGPGTVNSLIYDDGVYDDLRALLGGAERNKVIKYFIRESIKNSEKKTPR
ncbi:MAG TPA: MlaD family protein [Bacteriovoracaceae bacterium]|nr:MlaD family protein [Bacteriovoracaceae bacterium]